MIDFIFNVCNIGIELFNLSRTLYLFFTDKSGTKTFSRVLKKQ
jgi:hypothetical protein